MITLTITSLENLRNTARTLLDLAEEHRVFAFHAPMGTGKTTFITALCEELGVGDPINSPTFAIVNEYEIPDKQEVIYHMDCYRLERMEDAFNVGFQDYLSSGSYCFIEWPEIIESLLPDDVVRIEMCEREDGARLLSCDL